MPALSYEDQKALAANRWRWWYSRLVDWMIENPGRPICEAARTNGGPFDATPTYLQLITRSDLFRAHYDKRAAELRDGQTAAILASTHKLVSKTTEFMLEHLEKKRDAVPIEVLHDIRTSALEQLGFGRKDAPLVQVNNVSRVQIAVDASALLEAREALRTAERLRSQEPAQLGPPTIEATTVGGPNACLEAEEFAHALRIEDAAATIEREGRESDEGVLDWDTPLGVSVGSNR